MCIRDSRETGHVGHACRRGMMVLSGVCVINSAKQQNRIGPTLDAVYFSDRKNVAVDCHFLGYQCVRQKCPPEAFVAFFNICLLYTSDAADEEDSVDLGGRRIIKKKKK